VGGKRRSIAVVGSINRDFVIVTDAFPEAGETVLGYGFDTMDGGKGANQAAAAAVLGGLDVEVHLLGAVGSDERGDAGLQALEAVGVGVSHVSRHDGESTGTAFVIVDSKGANQIVVVPGANQQIGVDAVAEAVEEIQPDVVLISLEINQDAIRAAAIWGRKVGATVIINPAPYCAFAREVLLSADVVIPNEIEFRQLTSAALGDELDHATVAALIEDSGLAHLVHVITTGASGAIVVENKAVSVIAAPTVQVVDTVGAGDAFTGGFAVAMALGSSFVDAARFAVGAGTAAVMTRGARLVADPGLRGRLLRTDPAKP
jgi:ribokinase